MLLLCQRKRDENNYGLSKKKGDCPALCLLFWWAQPTLLIFSSFLPHRIQSTGKLQQGSIYIYLWIPAQKPLTETFRGRLCGNDIKYIIILSYNRHEKEIKKGNHKGCPKRARQRLALYSQQGVATPCCLHCLPYKIARALLNLFHCIFALALINNTVGIVVH